MPFQVGNKCGAHKNHARGFKCRNMTQLKDMRWMRKGEDFQRIPSVEVERWVAEGWVYGRPQPSEESRQKMSEAQKKRVGRVRALPGARLNSWYKTRYNRTTADFDAKYKEQGDHCALCPAIGTPKRRLCWDHDHKCCSGIRACGKCVRGLLCIKCNNKVGHLEQMMKDGLVPNASSGTWLDSALKYLSKYSSYQNDTLT